MKSIICQHPCNLHDPGWLQEHQIRVEVDEKCDGCNYCITAFECPALMVVPGEERVRIDRRICTNCGQCIDACYQGLIVAAPEVSDA